MSIWLIEIIMDHICIIWYRHPHTAFPEFSKISLMLKRGHRRSRIDWALIFLEVGLLKDEWGQDTHTSRGTESSTRG